MDVYALYGPSGTGKSDSSLLLAYQKQISAIIDDGLLIYQGAKYAGFSAKYEKNKMTAIKRATFFFEDHVTQVKSALKELNVDKILLLGTSKKMVERIAERLDLGMINHWVNIDEIRTPSEIEKALFVRKTEGKHVIPVPHVQIDQTFFKKVVTRGMKIFSPQKEVIGETTVVQPNFHEVLSDATLVHPNHQMGAITIAEPVLTKTIKLSCHSFLEIESADSIKIDLARLPIIKLNLSLKYAPTLNIPNLTRKVQRKIYNDCINYLGIECQSIDICVKKIMFDPPVPSL